MPRKILRDHLDEPIEDYEKRVVAFVRRHGSISPTIGDLSESAQAEFQRLLFERVLRENVMRDHLNKKFTLMLNDDLLTLWQRKAALHGCSVGNLIRLVMNHFVFGVKEAIDLPDLHARGMKEGEVKNLTVRELWELRASPIELAERAAIEREAAELIAEHHRKKKVRKSK